MISQVGLDIYTVKGRRLRHLAVKENHPITANNNRGLEGGSVRIHLIISTSQSGEFAGPIGLLGFPHLPHQTAPLPMIPSLFPSSLSSFSFPQFRMFVNSS